METGGAMPRGWGNYGFATGRPFDLSNERLIALSRVVIVAFSLVASYLDPVHQPENAREIQIILGLYLVLALVILGAMHWNRLGTIRHWPMQIADVGFISGLIYLSNGPSSPYFVLYTFVLVGAALRPRWQDAAWTTALLFLLLMLGVWPTGPGIGICSR